MRSPWSKKPTASTALPSVGGIAPLAAAVLADEPAVANMSGGPEQNRSTVATDSAAPQAYEQNLNPNAALGSPFQYAAPDGSAKIMSAVLGEIVWLMSQSPIHKSFFISDLEWPAAQAANQNKPMTPVILKQFRLFYDSVAQATNKVTTPIGVVFWGTVSEEVEQRLATGTSKLRPQDRKSGSRLWVVEVIAPFGGTEEMRPLGSPLAGVKDLREKVFPTREIKMIITDNKTREARTI